MDRYCHCFAGSIHHAGLVAGLLVSIREMSLFYCYRCVILFYFCSSGLISKKVYQLILLLSKMEKILQKSWILTSTWVSMEVIWKWNINLPIPKLVQTFIQLIRKNSVLSFFFSGLTLATIVFGFIRNMFLFNLLVRCAQSLHDRMFTAILRTPVRFFDINPIGKFHNHLYTLTDQSIAFLNCLFSCMSKCLFCHAKKNLQYSVQWSQTLKSKYGWPDSCKHLKTIMNFQMHFLT